MSRNVTCGPMQRQVTTKMSNWKIWTATFVVKIPELNRWNSLFCFSWLSFVVAMASCRSLSTLIHITPRTFWMPATASALPSLSSRKSLPVDFPKASMCNPRETLWCTVGTGSKTKTDKSAVGFKALPGPWVRLVILWCFWSIYGPFMVHVWYLAIFPGGMAMAMAMAGFMFHPGMHRRWSRSWGHRKSHTGYEPCDSKWQQAFIVKNQRCAREYLRRWHNLAQFGTLSSAQPWVSIARSLPRHPRPAWNSHQLFYGSTPKKRLLWFSSKKRQGQRARMLRDDWRMLWISWMYEAAVQICGTISGTVWVPRWELQSSSPPV